MGHYFLFNCYFYSFIFFCFFWINFTSFSPFFCLCFIFNYNAFSNSIWVYAYIRFEVGNTLFSSKKDLEGSIIVFIVLATIISILYLMGVRIDFNFDYSIIQRADLFLAIPVGIDFLLFLILR